MEEKKELSSFRMVPSPLRLDIFAWEVSMDVIYKNIAKYPGWDNKNHQILQSCLPVILCL